MNEDMKTGMNTNLAQKSRFAIDFKDFKDFLTTDNRKI